MIWISVSFCLRKKTFQLAEPLARIGNFVTCLCILNNVVRIFGSDRLGQNKDFSKKCKQRWNLLSKAVDILCLVTPMAIVGKPNKAEQPLQSLLDKLESLFGIISFYICFVLQPRLISRKYHLLNTFLTVFSDPC